MSCTFQVCIDFRSANTLFTGAPQRHLVWVSRAKHFTLSMAPKGRDFPPGCRSAQDFFALLKWCRWRCPYGNDLTANPGSAVTRVMAEAAAMWNPSRAEFVQTLRARWPGPWRAPTCIATAEKIRLRGKRFPWVDDDPMGVDDGPDPAPSHPDPALEIRAADAAMGPQQEPQALPDQIKWAAGLRHLGPSRLDTFRALAGLPTGPRGCWVQLHVLGVRRLSEWLPLEAAAPPGHPPPALENAIAHMLAHALTSSEPEWQGWTAQAEAPSLPHDFSAASFWLRFLRCWHKEDMARPTRLLIDHKRKTNSGPEGQGRGDLCIQRLSLTMPIAWAIRLMAGMDLAPPHTAARRSLLPIFDRDFVLRPELPGLINEVTHAAAAGWHAIQHMPERGHGLRLGVSHHGNPAVPIAKERAAQLMGIMREGLFSCNAYRIRPPDRTGYTRADRTPAPDSTFPHSGLKVAFQAIKECNANKWHSTCARTTATPHRDSYGPPVGATPEDRDEAIGAYLTAPIDPKIAQSLLHDLGNGTPTDWPRLGARPPQARRS